MTSSHYVGGGVQNPTGAVTGFSGMSENIEIAPVLLTAEDGAPSRGLFYRPKGKSPRVGIHIMHPRTDQSSNYNIDPLVAAGYSVLGRASRWPNNDVATIHELLLLDLAAGVRYLREQGCDKIVLLGNSGGSSLAAFYQAQASLANGARLTETPAGDPLDLNRYELPAADAVVIVGGHVGQGLVLGKMIDPAVVDEKDPLATDESLDLYHPRNGFATPPASSRYDEKFLSRYRTAQLERVRRIDATARSTIARQREAEAVVDQLGDRASLAQRRAARFEPLMIVYRTTADPAFVDLHIDPDDRIVSSYFGSRPDLENYGADGFARYITPRAWLSTWSALSSKARTIDNLRAVRQPLLIVHYAGECGTRMAEVRAMVEGSGSEDKSLHIVRGADHYGFVIGSGGAKGPRTREATDKVREWVGQRLPVNW